MNLNDKFLCQPFSPLLIRTAIPASTLFSFSLFLFFFPADLILPVPFPFSLLFNITSEMEKCHLLITLNKLQYKQH